MATSKVRVQLLDPKTGAVIEEVDVLTSADSVSFTDGETFQQKLDSNKLKGQKGDTGTQGIPGLKGDTGLQGIQGVKGDKGDTGVNGADGKTLLSGTTNPTTQGVNGDFYLNTATSTIYGPKTGSGWGTGTSIKGAQGVKGDTGNQGTPGIKGDTGQQGIPGVKGDTGQQGIPGAKGDAGDNVKVGATLAAATEVKLFFKKM